MSEISGFLDAEGRLKQFPAKRKKKLLALEYLAGKLDKDAVYTEKQVNELLTGWHTFGDPATLRRELFTAGFLNRTPDGSQYRLADPQPTAEALLERYS